MNALPVTRRDGTTHLIQYDDEDHALLSPYTWSVASRHRKFYAVAHQPGSGKPGWNVYMHRLLLPDAPTVDHINLDGLDNRRANLRVATYGQNNANRPPFTNQYKGVIERHGKYGVKIKDRWVGTYPTPEAAAAAYDAAALAEYGEYAWLNFPVGVS